MTRDEQIRLRDADTALMHSLRTCGKQHGYQVHSGILYKKVSGFVYKLIVFVSPSDAGRMFRLWLSCKPLALDDVFQDIFLSEEKSKLLPFGFRPRATLSAGALPLDNWKEPAAVGTPEMEAALHAALASADCRIEEAASAFHTVGDFSARIEQEPLQRLNLVLCRICEGDFPGAIRLLDEAVPTDTSEGKAEDSPAMKLVRTYCEDREKESEESTRAS